MQKTNSTLSAIETKIFFVKKYCFLMWLVFKSIFNTSDLKKLIKSYLKQTIVRVTSLFSREIKF